MQCCMMMSGTRDRDVMCCLKAYLAGLSTSIHRFQSCSQPQVTQYGVNSCSMTDCRLIAPFKIFRLGGQRCCGLHDHKPCWQKKPERQLEQWPECGCDDPSSRIYACAAGKFATEPTFTSTNEGGKLLDVRFEHSSILWPWSGYLALYVRVSPEGASYKVRAHLGCNFTKSR